MKSTELKEREERVRGECPECDRGFAFGAGVTLEDAEGVTTDCNECGALLLIEGGRVYEFNKKQHSEDSRWPADGNNTGSVEV